MSHFEFTYFTFFVAVDSLHFVAEICARQFILLLIIVVWCSFCVTPDRNIKHM